MGIWESRYKAINGPRSAWIAAAYILLGPDLVEKQTVGARWSLIKLAPLVGSSRLVPFRFETISVAPVGRISERASVGPFDIHTYIRACVNTNARCRCVFPSRCRPYGVRRYLRKVNAFDACHNYYAGERLLTEQRERGRERERYRCYCHVDELVSYARVVGGVCT